MRRLNLKCKFLISQQSEKLWLELTDWDWDVEDARTCILFSYIPRTILRAVEGKKDKLHQKVGLIYF